MITLCLPVPPSSNAMYANARRGRVKTEAYLDWIAEADAYYLQQKRSIEPLRGDYRLTIRLPANTKGDLDNRIKAVSDYLVSREITSDDKHCQQFIIGRDHDVTDCVVEVESA
jgi:Holliday junction resolvase RusA-like endonuclease